jgi:hypothetical protein
VQFKRSFWCGLGVALESTVYAIIAALYEILTLLQAVFTSFALPYYAVNIRVPTFLATLSDVQTAFCGLAAAIAGLLPLTFSCSAQLDTPGSSNNVPLPPPPNPWGQPIELAPLNQRDQNSICTFNRFGWASGSDAFCDCSSSIWNSFTFAILATSISTPACTLRCAQDLWDPIFFGAPYLPSNLRALVAGAINARVQFTNSSTLVAFLPTAEYPLSSTVVYPFGTIAQPNNYAGGPVTDPSPTDATFGGGEWLAQLLTALINDRVTAMFSQAVVDWIPDVNFSLCINSTMPLANSANPRIQAGFNTFLQSFIFGPFRMSDYIAVINLFVFGSGLMTGYWQTNQAFINSIFQTGTPTNALATGIMVLAAGVYPNGSASGTTVAESTDFFLTVLGPILEYNAMFLGNGTCRSWPLLIGNESVYLQCFANDGLSTSEPSGPIIAPLASNFTVQPGVAPVLCTYAPANWVGPTGGCDCSFPVSYQQYGVSPVCTLFCDPPSYPLFVGALPSDCLLPGTCAMSAGGNFFDYADVIAGLTAPVSGLDNHVAVLGYHIPLANTPNFYKNFLATFLSIYYIRRYNPTQYIYFRTLDDPLYGANCIMNTTDQQLWAGVNVEVMLRIVNTSFFGDTLAPNRTSCSGFYLPTSAEFTVCSNFVRQYPDVQGTAWGAVFVSNILPVLALVQNYYPSCSLSENCFVWSTFAGTEIGSSLPGSMFVPGPVGLPTLNLVVPEFAGLPDYTAATMPLCSDTLSCYTNTGCSFGKAVVAPFQLAATILGWINTAIATGGNGGWSLGNNFFDILKQGLPAITMALFDALTGFFFSADCTICAISGNVVGSPLCSHALSDLAQQIFGDLDTAITLIIDLAVDLLDLLVSLIYAIATGNFDQAVLALRQVLQDLGNIFLDIAEAIVGYVLGQACLCTVFQGLFNWPPTCIQAGQCTPSGKRALFSSGPIAALDAINWTYQLFAADWPSTTYTWPTGDWCGTQMPQLAALATNGVLTTTQAETATYCLGKLAFATRPVSVGAGQLDGCARTLSHMAARPATAFTAFDIATQSAALECIAKYGLTQAAKLGSASMLSWLPDNLLTTSDNPLISWASVGVNGIKGYVAQQERERDTTLPNTTTASGEYQSALRVSWGPARVALVQEYLATGMPAPLSAYVAAMYPGSGSTKRNVIVDDPATGAASFWDQLMSGVDSDLIPSIVSTVDRRMASMPPVYTSGSPPVIVDLPTAVLYKSRTLVRSLWRVPSGFHKLGALSQKRSSVLPSRATTRAAASLLWQGIAGVATTAMEFFSGAAHRNATGVGGGARTSVKWTLATQAQRAPATPRASFATRLLGGNIMARWGTFVAGLGQLKNAIATRPTSQASRSLTAIAAGLGKAWGIWTDSVDAQDFDPTQCFFSQEFCTDCLYLDNLFGYWVLFVDNAIGFYTNNNPGQNASTFAYLQYDFNRIDTQLRTVGGPAIFGNSPLLPARFPTPSTSFWNDYLNDNIVGKLGFSDIQPLVDLTTNFFVNFFETYDYFNPNPFAISDVPHMGNVLRPADVPAAEQISVIAMKQIKGLMPVWMVPNLTNVDFTIPGLDLRIRGQAAQRASGLVVADTAPTWANFSNIAFEWFNFTYRTFGACFWDAQMKGTAVRISLGQAAFSFFVALLVFAALSLAFPGVATVIFGTTLSIFGITIGIVIIAIAAAFSLATGWALGCTLAIPPIFFSAQVMQFLSWELFPDCFLFTNALVNNDNYDTTNCVSCNAWTNGTFEVLSCNRDLGWSNPLSVPVFLLSQLEPPWLAFIQNPSNFPFPFNLIIGGQTIQSWLHHFDGVNFTCPNPPPNVTGPAKDFSPECLPYTKAYSQQWTCAIFIELIPTIIFIYVLFALLLFNPVQSFVQSVLYTLIWLIAAAGYLLFALLFGYCGVWLALPVRYLQAVSTKE